MSHRFNWFVVIAGVLLTAAIGVVAFNMGVSHGLAIGVPSAGAPPAAGPYPYPYGYRPWGFGFFPLAPLFFIFFFLFVARGMFWGGYRRRCGSFDDWHRRAHERMDGNTPPTPEVR
jgi:hypothetical protein